MKWAGMFVWTIQIAARKPEWFRRTNDDCQPGDGTFPENKRKLLQENQKVRQNQHKTKSAPRRKTDEMYM
jgi:hypothetical protein